MHDSADRLDFAPPPQPAAVRAFALAIMAHVLLMLALTWGISWNRDSENVAAEAELWSSVPQQAAPKVVTAPPLPAPPPPKPEPKPEPKVEPPPAPPVSKAPDIALEREKKRRELAKRRQEELEREEKLEARKRQEELKRQEVAEQKAEEEKKKKKAEELAKKAKQDEARVEARRKENLDKMMKAAAGTGAPSSSGTAAQSSGPSSSWAGRIQAAVYPNIVFRETVSTRLRVEVEIRMSPDGTIVGTPVVRKSSGNPAWDEAVLRGLDKTGVLPRDLGGKVYSPAFIGFSHGGG